MTATERCAELRDALTEVALGVAGGTTRGVVMAHLTTCESCRSDLASLAATADEVLLLVPEREPSAGFEGRVLARLVPEQRPRSSAGRARRAVLAAALGAGLLGIGGAGVWIATEPDRDLAASYRTTLDTADGRYLAAADLTAGTAAGASARSVGTVFLYEGDPTWAYVVVRGAGAAPRYDVTVTVTTTGGPEAGTREIALGPCVVVADECSAGGVLDASVGAVDSVRLTGPDGATWATATPDNAWP